MTKYLTAVFFILLAITSYGQHRSVKSTQEVANIMINNPDIMILTGTVYDLEEQQMLKDMKFRMKGTGNGIIDAAIDESGYYAVAIDCTEVNFPIKLKIKLPGYKKVVIKDIAFNEPYTRLDLALEPEIQYSEINNDKQIKLTPSIVSTFVMEF